MSVFLGTHQNRVDAKGRVSIPAPFRSVLRAWQEKASAEDSLLVLRPSPKHPCIEAWPSVAFMALGPNIDTLDLFSDDQEDMALSLYADAYPMDPDKEGRITLPEFLSSHASLTDSVTFMGLGRHFQIWEPEAAERRRTEARNRARGLTLPAQPGAAGGA
ncbi:division/cell wall cluster transcriptional repressor MraZ [Acetobacteraceae bacterium KSS8]|uniref:Transcriptional regulator MraZ n=1 Tax=Endosaccharibacter trunci TaxID=2812733 RepID=A0ABT1W2V3_9PROT|nr:division/cell wall cluster transcriptional repressor MraZ [Acetobacteraceae bacterium KSS8]